MAVKRAACTLSISPTRQTPKHFAFFGTFLLFLHTPHPAQLIKEPQKSESFLISKAGFNGYVISPKVRSKVLLNLKYDKKNKINFVLSYFKK